MWVIEAACWATNILCCALARRRNAYCSNPRCRNAITRTVWDGDEVLHEISAPATGANMERDTGHVNVYPGPYYYGRMTYVHGGGIDQPLVAVRHEYSDSLTDATRIFPQTNYRGQYEANPYPRLRVTPPVAVLCASSAALREMPSPCRVSPGRTGFVRNTLRPDPNPGDR